ncbi:MULTISPECIES: hypothetical protein [Aphanizomenonaceae]|uniref:Transposase n=1 Tax=Dolichospermum heterosporum TAC447 TaxID=747523 RepID=A0ABY5LXR3_9CYAN|nr:MULTISPECIES: hypothetical protein [Aphanizomenonaceae]UUO16807.1 hypothetical protein NG743_07235 [Dolichospermum heterosporum TAC447]
MSVICKGLAHALPCSSLSHFLNGNAITEALPKAVRELHKKNDPILWDGHLARLCIISGLFGLHHKKFWDIF